MRSLRIGTGWWRARSIGGSLIYRGWIATRRTGITVLLGRGTRRLTTLRTGVPRGTRFLGTRRSTLTPATRFSGSILCVLTDWNWWFQLLVNEARVLRGKGRRGRERLCRERH